jgi:hypothetical protein
LWLLLDNALGWSWVAVGATGTVAAAAIGFAVAGILKHRRAGRGGVEVRESSPESPSDHAGYRQSRG